MLTFRQFLAESAPRYTPLEKFVIQAWGRLLYLDYESLPGGKDQSGSPELAALVREYAEGSEDERDDLDEWIAEGARLKNGTALLTRATVDAVLAGAQHRAPAAMTLYRFHSGAPLRPGSWVSMTADPSETRYDHVGKRHEYHIKRGDPIIDAHGLADEDEVIVRTDVLLGNE